MSNLWGHSMYIATRRARLEACEAGFLVQIMIKLLLYFSWLMCQNGRKETTKVMFVWSLTNIGVQESLSVRWSFKKLINLTTAYSNAVLQIRNPKRSKYTFLKVIFEDWQTKCFIQPVRLLSYKNMWRFLVTYLLLIFCCLYFFKRTFVCKIPYSREH